MQNIYFILIKSKNHIFNHLSKTQNIFKTTKKKYYGNDALSKSIYSPGLRTKTKF